MIPCQIERIVDRAGAVLEEGRPVPRDALRPDTAYIMVSLMRGVVQRGTGARARQLGWPVGGKTGTIDDYTDAWFVGFDPEITLGCLGRLRREEDAGRWRGRGAGGPPDLARLHASLHRRTPKRTRNRRTSPFDWRLSNLRSATIGPTSLVCCRSPVSILVLQDPTNSAHRCALPHDMVRQE